MNYYSNILLQRQLLLLWEKKKKRNLQPEPEWKRREGISLPHFRRGYVFNQRWVWIFQIYNRQHRLQVRPTCQPDRSKLANSSRGWGCIYIKNRCATTCDSKEEKQKKKGNVRPPPQHAKLLKINFRSDADDPACLSSILLISSSCIDCIPSCHASSSYVHLDLKDTQILLA